MPTNGSIMLTSGFIMLTNYFIMLTNYFLIQTNGFIMLRISLFAQTVCYINKVGGVRILLTETPA